MEENRRQLIIKRAFDFLQWMLVAATVQGIGAKVHSRLTELVGDLAMTGLVVYIGDEFLKRSPPRTKSMPFSRRYPLIGQIDVIIPDYIVAIVMVITSATIQLTIVSSVAFFIKGLG